MKVRGKKEQGTEWRIGTNRDSFVRLWEECDLASLLSYCVSFLGSCI